MLFRSLTVENGCVVDGKMERLEQLYQMGVRPVSYTHLVGEDGHDADEKVHWERISPVEFIPLLEDVYKRQALWRIMKPGCRTL